mmetsp:Transcript_11196/g.31755  ORF Transcript_11196/g.31755 Transcript_11196/m.31755 type:complete len:145 (-) Transcript_11196:627-1061(-)
MWTPQVKALMEWTENHNFPLSTNLHGGALVSSYPFDGCDRNGWETTCPTPEDPTPKNLALAVAELHLRMSSREVTGFDDGITRGSVWYPVLGGMQVNGCSAIPLPSPLPLPTPLPPFPPPSSLPPFFSSLSLPNTPPPLPPSSS